MASKKPYVLNKEDGTVVDLCRMNERGRKAILAGMKKDFDNYCRKYNQGFNPPPRQLEEEVDNISRHMYNLLAFKEYYRDVLQPQRPEVNEMLIVYRDWLRLDHLHPDDEGETSFYDAEVSVPGNTGGSRPITPIPEETRASPAEETLAEKKKTKLSSSLFPINDKLQALFARKQTTGSERAASEHNAVMRRTPSSASADRLTDPDALRKIANSPSFRDIVSQYHGGRKDGEQARDQQPPFRGITNDQLEAIRVKTKPLRDALSDNKDKHNHRDSSPESKRSDKSEGENPKQENQPAKIPPGAEFSLNDLHQIISNVLDARLDTSLPEFVTTVIDSRLGMSPPYGAGAQGFDLNILSDTVIQIVDDRLNSSLSSQVAQMVDNRLRSSPFSPDVVSQMVKTQVDETLRMTPPFDGSREGGCSYRSKEHLKELVKFSGSIEEFATFRQQLSLCLEREKFRDDRDKALFVYRYLAGPARDLVTHFIRPLSDDSYTRIVNRLDWTYGGEKDLDRLLIKKLQKLPKIASFSQDSLIHMIVTIESAIPALIRREPESVTAEDGERLNRLLNLLPQMEMDFFFNHCVVKNRRQNLKGLLCFLKDKFESRRNHVPYEKEKRSEKRPSALPLTRTKGQNAASGRYIYYQEKKGSDTDSTSEDDQVIRRPHKPVLKAEDSTSYTKEKAEVSCPKCKGTHFLAKCSSFKSLTSEEKRNFVRTSKVCIKCLVAGHFIRECKRKGACGQNGCKDKHHPLLHDEYIHQAKFMAELGDGEDCETSAPKSEEESSSDEA